MTVAEDVAGVTVAEDVAGVTVAEGVEGETVGVETTGGRHIFCDGIGASGSPALFIIRRSNLTLSPASKIDSSSLAFSVCCVIARVSRPPSVFHGPPK